MPFAPIPTSIAPLVQQNKISLDIREGLRVNARFRLDATPKKLPPGVGQTMTFNQLGQIDVSLRPAPPVGGLSMATFPVEQYTAAPRPYGISFPVDAPTRYVQTGDYALEATTRLVTWAGRMQNGLSAARLFGYAGGQSIIRRAQTTSDSVLLVNSLLGLKSVPVNGTLQPVSATTPLTVTIVAGTTFTAQVTGVTPLDADFPDGAGELTLAAPLTAAVTMTQGSQPYVYSAAKPVVVRAGAKASTEALAATDVPTLANIRRMMTQLANDGVPRHPDGTYHLHIDPSFSDKITADPTWGVAFQSAGLNPILGAGTFFAPSLGLTLIEGNDAMSANSQVTKQIGAAGAINSGSAVGSPYNSLSLQSNGLDVVNSNGVNIHRAILTGADVLVESYVDEMDYLVDLAPRIGDVVDASNLGVYQIGNGGTFVAGNVDRCRLTIMPPMDPRQLVTLLSISFTNDYVLGTDYFAASDQFNTGYRRPLKRAVVLEYGADY